ncbi:hypothetical protein BC833DRAFT_313278 [Globomyces pollinis-pini]|nr:hypothetical protein BC833DRAFT_313278 [Globomyces pollinis-pini]
MSDVISTVNNETARIYGVPVIPNISQNSKGHDFGKKSKVTTVLPPMTNEEENNTHSRQGSAHSSVGGRAKSIQTVTRLQLESHAAQLERLRVILRERELEIVRVKTENSILKQRERKHQKDIEQLEVSTNDAPRIIKGLRDEIHIHKAKIRHYFSQIGEDSRMLRQFHDDRNRLKEQIKQLEQTIAENDIGSKEKLQSELSDTTKKLTLLQQVYKETEKSLELIDRNLSADNRQLRGKIHFLEREKTLIQDQTDSLKEIIREKDKEIASLSIYRYNAIHRKAEVVCKVCLKREKDESELKRKREIREHLPPMEVNHVKVTSATSVELTLGYSTEIEPKAWKFNSMSVSYSSDPTMSSNVLKKKLDPSNYQKSLKRPIIIEGLQCGTQYYFNIVVGFDDVLGDPSRPISALVDCLPNELVILSASANSSPPSFDIIFQPTIGNKGSDTLSYKVYHSPTSDFKEYFLALNSPKEEVKSLEGSTSLKVCLSDPQIAVNYYFKVSAVNKMGEGPLSEMSSRSIIDFPPPAPNKPSVKRQTSLSVLIAALSKNGIGSPTVSFRIQLFKVVEVNGEKVREANPDFEFKALATSCATPGYKELQYQINELIPGTTYQVKVYATNEYGESEESEWSDEIDIEGLVPAMNSLQIEVASSDSFRVILPTLDGTGKPKINGYKLKWSLSPDMHPLLGKSDMIPLTEESVVVNGLQDGATYYVTGCLVGDLEEGMDSPVSFVPLAAYIPLPKTPVPQSVSFEDSPKEEDIASEADSVKRSSQFGSNLSINQRVANMHHGMPAYHEPPVLDESNKSRDSNVTVDSPSHQNRVDFRKSKSQLVKDKFRKSEPRLSHQKSTPLHRAGSLPQLTKSSR